MLTIRQSSDIPDGTYFTTGDVEPEMGEDAVLTIYNGQGTRRGWGSPQVTSTVLLNTEDLVAIHVGYSHKHRGGQFYRYYTREEEGGWIRVAWRDLEDESRQRVLDAAGEHAPSWADSPGKLKSERKRPAPSPHRITYKLVEVIDEQFYFSVYDGVTQYQLGTAMKQRAVSDHGGGYYSYPSLERAVELFWEGEYFPSRCYRETMTIAVLKCEVWGTCIRYSSGKIATTNLLPSGEVARFHYHPRDLEQEERVS